MKPTFDWRGKTDPEDKSGVAQFYIGGTHITLNLPDFLTASYLFKHIEQVYAQGGDDAITAAKRKITQVLNEI